MGPMTPRGRTWIFVLLLAVAAGYFADAHLPGLLADDLPEAEAVLVRKTDRTLYLLRDGRPYREYPVAFGANPVGHKEREGAERYADHHRAVTSFGSLPRLVRGPLESPSGHRTRTAPEERERWRTR